MNPLVKSYLSYTRGESRLSPWAFLKPAGWLSRAVVLGRRAFYDHGVCASEEAPLPVISVGNLVTGGTNKTPFVEYITSRLLEFGLKPGIVSRGYGRHTSDLTVIAGGKGDRRSVGDEPSLLSSHLPEVPVAVSSDRAADVRALCERNVDIVVADDAFQHRKVARALDIVLIDAICPFGNGAPLPDGILRELPSSLARAHIVVITKADQAPEGKLRELTAEIARWVPPQNVFLSRLSAPVWFRLTGGSLVPAGENLCLAEPCAAFSGIGNPKSFFATVEKCGMRLVSRREFKDHHHYAEAELSAIEGEARSLGASALCCTEKDVFNLPDGYVPRLPLYVPRIFAELDDEPRFWRAVASALRPRLIVASNGYGEDAIGAALALRLRKRYPHAEVCAFPLVGRGEQYGRIGVDILSPVADSPTGGIIKYHLKDLRAEIKAGLFGHIGSQLRTWKSVRSRCCTVLCVGDAYLLCHTIWGQGKKALLLATAKTKYISGHWKLESFLYRGATKKVWTRDEATARELLDNGVNAAFEGNPIMDLQCAPSGRKDLWGDGRRILVLPGSRGRAYADLALLLDTLGLIARNSRVSAIMVLAPSIDADRIVSRAEGWTFQDEVLRKGEVSVRIFCGDVTEVARGAELLLGLAGTANQVCAGMGIPVLSILEKGKLVQKKLLGDAELLVEPDPRALAQAALRLLADARKLSLMSEAGKKRLGARGAIDSVLEYVESELGWGGKCETYRRLSEALNAKGVLR